MSTLTTTSTRQWRFMVSYAKTDGSLVHDLLARLGDRLGMIGGHHFDLWEFGQLPPGIDHEREITEHVKSSDFVIHCLSPAFFNSKFIRQVEIDRFVGASPAGRTIPVMLKDVFDIAKADLRGFKELWIVRGDAGSYQALDAEPGPRADFLKDQFATTLANGIIDRLKHEGLIR